MKYFKMSVNTENKKWKKKRLVSAFLFDEQGNEINELDIEELKEHITQKLFYKVLREGNVTPIDSIGVSFIIFNGQIPHLETLKSDDIQWSPLFNFNNNDDECYLIMHIPNHIDCVNWAESYFERWPEGYEPESWEAKRGQIFIDPVLIKEKIPTELSAFRLHEWEDAFNIIISEEYKNKILSLDFEHSFLEFKELRSS